MIQNNPELFELSMSEKTQPLMDLVKHHCEENIKPIQAEYSALQNEKEDIMRKNVLIASEPRVEILYREMNSIQF